MSGMSRKQPFKIYGIRAGNTHISRGWKILPHLNFWMQGETAQNFIKLKATYTRKRKSTILATFEINKTSWSSFRDTIIREAEKVALPYELK